MSDDLTPSDAEPEPELVEGKPAGGRTSPLDELEHWLEIDRKRNRRAAASAQDPPAPSATETETETAPADDRLEVTSTGSVAGEEPAALAPETTPAAPGAAPESSAEDSAEDSLLEVLAAIDGRAARAPLTLDPGRATALGRAGERRVVVFSLRGAHYALPVGQVMEIGSAPAITWVPNLPAWIRGVTNLRGDILAVLDLASFAGEAEAAATARMLVLRSTSADQTAGLLVEQVHGIRPLAASAVQPPTSAIEGRVVPYILGCAEIDDHIVSLLDLDPLLAALEIGSGAVA